ncbi:MAG TPA: serine hydrolase, partial [Chitinophagaceae bacterium]|nr:serine hydrolase [Chitinophagaceae bacterium]
MNKIFWFLLIIPFFAAAQKNDRRLESTIREAINGYKGDIGIYVKNLRTGKTVSLNADTIFPTASIVKVPILVGIMDKMERKELNYDSVLVYKD